VAHSHEAWKAGYQFLVLPSVWIVHIDHGVPKWRGKGDIMRARVYQNYYSFLAETEMKYLIQPPH